MTVVRSFWPSLRKVFVATSDARLVPIEARQALETEGFSFELFGHTGKTQTHASKSFVGAHLHDPSSVLASLSDLAALAHAPVIVGNFNSGFFRLAWVLNRALHRGERRETA